MSITKINKFMGNSKTIPTMFLKMSHWRHLSSCQHCFWQVCFSETLYKLEKKQIYKSIKQYYQYALKKGRELKWGAQMKTDKDIFLFQKLFNFLSFPNTKTFSNIDHWSVLKHKNLKMQNYVQIYFKGTTSSETWRF